MALVIRFVTDQIRCALLLEVVQTCVGGAVARRTVSTAATAPPTHANRYLHTDQTRRANFFARGFFRSAAQTVEAWAAYFIFITYENVPPRYFRAITINSARIAGRAKAMTRKVTDQIKCAIIKF